MEIKRMIAAVSAAALLTGCSSTKPSDSSEQPTATATTATQMESTTQAETSTESDTDIVELSRKLCTDMAEGNYKTSFDLFSDNMKAAVSEEALTSSWKQVKAVTGEFKELLDTQHETDPNSGMSMTTTNLRFENKNLVIYIAFSTERLIEGMYMNFAQVEITPEDNDIYTETSIKVGEYELDGMLTMPKNIEKPPVVILIQGSGQTNLNEDAGICAPFKDISHDLAEKGIATIRYNKRFFQYPELGTDDVTVDDEVLNDADAAVKLAQQYADDGKVDGIFVLGHSLGGMLAPSIASRNSAVKGIISLAGTPRKLGEVWLEQLAPQLEAAEGDTKKYVEELIDQIETMRDKRELKEKKNPEPYNISFGVPYWTSLDAIDPAGVARELDIPMLFLQGSADTQVFADKDFAMWKEKLSDRPKCQFKLYDGLGHFFDCENGHINSHVIEDTADFIKASLK